MEGKQWNQKQWKQWLIRAKLAGDKIIKVFDERYSKADVLNEARNEALVEENTDWMFLLYLRYPVQRRAGAWSVKK